jgi:WD40 repeat protein
LGDVECQHLSDDTINTTEARGGGNKSALTRRMRGSYVAFISYKHHAGLPLAERIAKALRNYARPLLKPPMRVFRDEEYFLPTESLPVAIREALEQSKFLVLLASNEAAASVWVCDELRIWCSELKRTSNLLIVLTKDEIAFDPGTIQVDWKATTALPAFLSEHMHDSPLYVDLRWVTEEHQLDLANAKFKKEINRLSARLREIDPEQMLNKEVITHRRNMWLARGAVMALVIFALSAVAGLLIAVQQRNFANQQRNLANQQRNLANQQRNLAEKALVSEQAARERAEAEAAAAASNLLATRARQRTAESPQLGVLLAAEAVYRLQQKNLPVTSAAAQTLIDIFQNASGIGLRGHRVDAIATHRDEQAGTFVSAVAVSPNSKWIATGDGDGRVLVRQAATPDTWIELLAGTPTSFLDHKQEIQALVFSADSMRLAASKFGEFQVWDLSTKPRTVAHTEGIGDFVHDLRFASDPRWLVSSGGGIRVWDTQANPPVSVLLPESKGLRIVLAMNGELVVSDAGYVWRWRDRQLVRKLPGIEEPFSLAVSPQGDKIAIGSSTGEVHVFWLASDEQKLFHHGDFISSVAFSRDGNTVASASWNRTVQLWDLTGKQEPLRYEHNGKVDALAFSPIGDHLATAGSDKRLLMWGTYWYYTAAPILLGGHDGDGSVTHLVFSPDGSFLVSGGFEPLPRLWRLQQLTPGVDVFRGSSYGRFESFAINAQKQLLAAVTRIKGPDVWKLHHPESPPVALADAHNNASQVDLSADGAWLASSGVGTDSYLWNLRTPDHEPRRLRARAGYKNKVLFSPDSSLIAGLDADGSILLESTSRTVVSPTRLQGCNKEPLVDFAFAPSVGHLAGVCPDGSAFTWELATGERRLLLPSNKDLGAIGIAYSPDGTHLAIAGAFIEWIDLESRTSVRLSPPRGETITKIAIGPDSKHVAAGTNTGTTVLWEMSSGGWERLDLSLHVGEVVAVAFSPDGSWLATATRSSFGVWSLRDLSAAPLRLNPEFVKEMSPMTSDRVTGISDALFLDHNRLAASTDDHLVIVWDLDFANLIACACKVAGRGLSSDEVVNQLDGSHATVCLTHSPARSQPQARSLAAR